MTLPDIARLRLANQQISSSTFNSARELVGWMGAMQAQDYNMSKWAIGCRLPHSTEKTVDAAIDNAEIFRTHVLRPTWHLVAADDIYWMLQLTAPRIKAATKPRFKELELSSALLVKSNTLIEKSLSGGSHLTRDELLKKFTDAGIATHDNRSSHLLAWAELDGLICSGTSKNNKLTYALLEERVKKPAAISKDEALSKLALKYFLSHGPATLRDFTWWSGLTATDATKGVELVKKDLVSANVGSDLYLMPGSVLNGGGKGKSSLYLLPAFDEYIISYKDRSAVIRAENQRKAISSNGLFRPVVVEDGKVIALWKRTIKDKGATIAIDFFKAPAAASKSRLKKVVERFGHFLGKSPELSFSE